MRWGPTRWTCAALALAACHQTPSKALLADVPEQGVCKVTAVQTSPWIVTLPAENSVDLDTNLTEPQGLIAVRYRGCEMDVLTRCKVPGSYHWKAASLATNAFSVENSDDLYAKMPIGATSIEGYLIRGDALRLSYTLSGRFTADRPAASYEELQQLGGDCASATHLVVGALGGAYDFESVAKAAVGGKAGSLAKYDSSARREMLNKRGLADACAKGEAGETAPPHNCGAPLKIELAEVICPADMHFEQEKGCVGGRGADGAGKPVIINAPAPVRGFATQVFAITRLALNAARGKPVPPESTGESFAENLEEVKAKYAALERAELVLSYAHVELKNAAGMGISVGAFVWPDGRTRWMRFGAGQGDPDALAPAAGLDVVRDDLVGHMVDGDCRLDVVTTSDFDAVPIPDENRTKIARKLEGVPQDLAEACTTLRGAAGPWQISMSEVEVFILTEQGLAAIKADVSWKDGAPQLGLMHLAIM